MTDSDSHWTALATPKRGDSVRCLDDSGAARGRLEVGKVYQVEGDDGLGQTVCLGGGWWVVGRFELVEGE